MDTTDKRNQLRMKIIHLELDQVNLRFQLSCLQLMCRKTLIRSMSTLAICGYRKLGEAISLSKYHSNT